MSSAEVRWAKFDAVTTNWGNVAHEVPTRLRQAARLAAL
jgi:hypothetical protein